MRILAEGEKRLTNGFGMFDDISDIPLDEIMALGAALTAASAIGLAAIEAMEERALRRAEKAEVTPADKILMVQALNDTLTSLGTMSKDALEGTASLMQEIGVFGSILPDEVG